MEIQHKFVYTCKEATDFKGLGTQKRFRRLIVITG